jgi:hypothetical protein
MKAIENEELQKKRIFIDEEDLDSKDEEENKGLTCLECTEMKATDDTLINGKEFNCKCQMVHISLMR